MKRPNRTTRRGTDERGQTLVEFALVFPIFFVLLMGMIEFGLVFNALLSINFASRDGSLIAAEAGSAVGSDCVILDKVERAIGAPSSTSRITEVRIYKADKNGNQVGSAVNVYDRSGTMTCTMAGGAPPMTVPYTLTGSAGYPDVNRCNIQGGCGGSGGVDTIGVKITYAYTPFTPLGSFIGIGSTSYTLVESNAMRMEPVL